jgi:hypothetical protein
MPANNTNDPATLLQRALAMKIIYYGFDDADLATIISNGQSNGYVDGLAYSTGTPSV